MAVSKSESARFGFDKTSPTPSPRSSPPTTSHQTPKSRLPIRNRQGTPQSEGSTSTATRMALTTIINRRTPSPHPSPDDGPQIKIIYGRNEGMPFLSNVLSPTTTESVAQQNKENMPGGELNAHRKSELSHVNKAGLNMADENPSSTTKALLEPAITITPGTPSRHSQIEQIEENKTTLESFDGSANHTRNFSHPGRRARTSLGGSSTHSINTGPDRESAAHLPTLIALPGHTFPPRTTSRAALTEDALTHGHENDHGGASPFSNEHNLSASSAQAEETANEDNDNGFRTVRLSLRSDTPFGPTLRISKEADQFLMGQTSKNSNSTRLRMPSFGTTSSDESAEKEVKTAVVVGEHARARRAPPTEDEYCLTKSISSPEQPDFGSSTNSASQNPESAGTRDTSASSSSNKFASVEGSTLIGERTRPIRDRNPSPHAALLFSRALGSGAPTNKANVLTKSETSPILMHSSSSPGSSPPMPPPKDKLLAEKETTVEIAEQENNIQIKQSLPPPKQQLGLRTRNLRSTAIPSPVRATPDSDRSWVVNLDSPESRGQTPTQYSRLHNGVARTSMGSGSFVSKKLPRTTSKPALVMSNLRSLFHRRSNNDTSVPELPKPALPSRSPKRQTISPLRFTPTSSPTSSTTAWTPSSTLTLTSPTKASTSRAKVPTSNRYGAVLSSMRPATRGKTQSHNVNTAPITSQVIDNENLARATSLALHLTSLAAQPSSDSATLIPLARTLITTITATRDAEAAMVAAAQKAEEAKVCWEGCQAGVRECLRLVEGSGVGGMGRK